MKNPIFCISEGSNALFFAKRRLQHWGYTVLPDPDPPATHLLLPVPTPPDAIPKVLNPSLTVLGGNLPPLPCPTADFLQDEFYLRENAAITADCAIALLQEHCTPAEKQILVIGWGRIGKVLARQLAHLGAQVTVAIRRKVQMAEILAAGLTPILLPLEDASQYQVIFNTAPAPVLRQAQALCIDLASQKGIAGDKVIWARGLPGKMAPEASGALIAKTALRCALRKE